MKRIALGLVLFANLTMFATFASGDEGMWQFNNLPLNTLQTKYGFQPSAPWLDHLMKSSVRLNSGGSGSFVSSDGLILTNHHVAADTLQKISSDARDYFKTGFYAATLDAEIKTPDLSVDELVSIVDVTDRVTAAVTPGMSAPEAFQAKQKVIAQIQKDATDASKSVRGDVMTFFSGAQYHLYIYKTYTDIRLVFAPELAIAFFGGDYDNFNYPRYDLDMAIFRAYENGQPAKVADFLALPSHGIAKDDLVFVSGHPGGTERLLTVSALETQRDVALPFMNDLLMERENMLIQYGYRGDKEHLESHEDLFGTQNSRKVYVGRLQGLQDPELFQRKAEADARLREAVPSAAGAWDQVATAETAYRAVYLKRALLERGYAFNSRLFQIARGLVRLATESAKPNSDRLPEYNDSARAALLRDLLSPAPVSLEFERAKLGQSLSFMAEKLPAESALLSKVLGGQSPAARAAELINSTRLTDVAARRRLVREGLAAIQNSVDPMIVFARLVDDDARAARKAYEDGVLSPEQQAYTQIAQARAAAFGTNQYPDATFTLRLSFGTVSGYEQDGSSIDPITTIGGAFEHEAAHHAQGDYLLPDSWHTAKASLDLSKPFDFAATADIIGGNSGSPVVNRDGQLVGLIFDGNIQSLVGDYLYDDTQNRSVAVASDAILEALRKVYGAAPLADALGR